MAAISGWDFAKLATAPAQQLVRAAGGGLRGPLLGGGDLVADPQAVAFLRGRRGDLLAQAGAGGGRRLRRGAAARPVDHGGERREGDEGPALGPVAPLGRPGPGDEQDREPHPDEGGHGEAGHETAAVRDGAGFTGHRLISSGGC
jgi:hypothetical protein